MKKLKSINIKGTKYRIIRKDLAKENLYGRCDTEKKTIEIGEELKGKLLQETFFHEFFHAVFEEVGINCCSNIHEDVQEIIVDNLATALVGVMRNELMKYTMEGGDE